jgi:hypothetical protein
MDQNICYSPKTSNRVIHLCSCLYLNQQRDRDDVLDFKQAIDAGNTVSLSRPGIRMHQPSQAKQTTCSAKPAIASYCPAIDL